MICFLGEWLSPIVSGDCPPPCYYFSLTALTDNTFLMFGGETADGRTNATYIGHCTKSTIVSIKYKLTTSLHFQVWLTLSTVIYQCL